MRWNYTLTLIIRKANILYKNKEFIDKDEVEMALRITLPKYVSNNDIWINRWVSNPILNQKLKATAKALLYRQEVTYYTDGSLTKE